MQKLYQKHQRYFTKIFLTLSLFGLSLFLITNTVRATNIGGTCTLDSECTFGCSLYSCSTFSCTSSGTCDCTSCDVPLCSSDSDCASGASCDLSSSGSIGFCGDRNVTTCVQAYVETCWNSGPCEAPGVFPNFPDGSGGYFDIPYGGATCINSSCNCNLTLEEILDNMLAWENKCDANPCNNTENCICRNDANGVMSCACESNNNAPPPPNSDDIPEGAQLGTGFDIAKLIRNIYRIMLPLAVLISFLLIGRAGYMFMTSQGDPRRVMESKENLTSAITGLLFVLLSVGILRVLLSALITGESPGF